MKKIDCYAGFFVKIKGRYTKRPRSIVNKRIFRYGRIPSSLVCSNVDYSFKRFESKYGTCSIKV